MKNFAMSVAIVVALICSQACAQKKSESGSGSAKVASKSAERAGSKSSKESLPESSSKATAKEASSTKADAADEATAKPKDKSTAADKTASRPSRNSKAAVMESLSDDEQKKVKSLMRQTLKPFTAVELTDEQRERADEVFGKAVRDFVVKRSRAMITDELQKKQAAAMKEAKSSSKNAREQVKVAFATAGFSEDQIKVFKATQASLNKAKKEFGKSLSPEQIESLPEALQALIHGEE